MNGNLVDYLVPVGEAGDRSFSNGKQEIVPTAEQQRKADEMIKQIAQQKQLELERGNVEHIMEILKKDTPDAAIYRALLLQQLENTNQLKKKDEDKKPGVIKRVAIGTAKFLGSLALRYLVMQTLMHAGDIYRLGPKLTWQKFLVENGVAKTPDLAEATGAATAALGDTIVRRNRSFQDLSEAQKSAVLGYAKEQGFLDKINTQSASFGLKNVYKKGDEYFDVLPKDAKLEDYTKVWGTVLNTGGKDSVIMPMTRSGLGDNLYDSIFKAGNARTVITPEDGWFLGNEGIRAVDNSFLHIGDLTGRNDLKRKAYFDSPEYYGFAPAAKKLAEISAKELTEKEMDDAVKAVVSNMNNVLAHSGNSAWLAETKFNIDPNKLDALIDKTMHMKRDFVSAKSVHDAMNPNTHYGISKNDLIEYITKVTQQKMTVMNPKDRLEFYKTITKNMSVPGLPAPFGGPYFSENYDPQYEKVFNPQYVVKKSGEASMITSALGLGAMFFLDTNPYTLAISAGIGVCTYLFDKLV